MTRVWLSPQTAGPLRFFVAEEAPQDDDAAGFCQLSFVRIARKWRESVAGVSRPVGVRVFGDFAGERAIDVNKVAGGKNHSDQPPDQSDL
jgi:hypothetical protein